MKQELEIEHKFHLDAASIPALESLLPSLGFAPAATENCTDIYFADADGRLVREKIVLRVRDENGVVTMDTKIRAQADNRKAGRVEKNYTFAGSTVTDITELLAVLGYRPSCSVTKARQPWQRFTSAGRVRVCIDDAGELGHFAEIEVACSIEASAETAHTILDELEKSLAAHLGTLETSSYRELALEALEKTA